MAQFVHDYDRQELRRGNKPDLVEFIKLGNVLNRDQGVGHYLLLHEVPPLLEPLETALVLAEYAHKPSPAYAWNVRQVDYLIEMGDILGQEDWCSWEATCFCHPLRFDRDVADRFVRQVREGGPAGLAGMPVAGVTTPVTLEGFVVVSSAEHVAVWLAARALNPQVPLQGGIWAGAPDMKTGHLSFCGFDGLCYGFAAREFMRKWCAMTLFLGDPEYCDAKLPGLYATLEKAYKAMTIAAFTGQHPTWVGQGMLDEGKVLSAVQLLLEREFAVGLQHLARQVVLSADNLALPTILEVGQGLQSTYLQAEHTARNFRRCLWLPEFFDRSGWNGFHSEEKLLRKAQDKVRSLLGEYVKPPDREDKLVQMRAVVEKARRDLLQ